MEKEARLRGACLRLEVIIMERFLWTALLIVVFGCAGEAPAAEKPLPGQDQQTCSKSWMTASESEKEMFLAGYLTAVRGSALILGDAGAQGGEKLLRQLWPLGDDTDAALAKMNAYCSRPENSDRSLALAIAQMARQKAH